MEITKAQIEAGQAIYSNQALAFYDITVHEISNHLIWKCPTHHLINHYNTHISSNHLDVGIGTGYFLDHCFFPSPNPRIALMDLNAHTLEFVSKRLAQYEPETYQRNILDKIPFDAPKFNSIGINYLLHCLPGDTQSKAIVFDNLMALMQPNAVIFGSTLLQQDVKQNWFAKQLMRFYNKKHIFSNQNDKLVELEQALKSRFHDVSIEVIGCAVLFSARL